MLNELPSHLKKVAESELLPGEEICWAARPIQEPPPVLATIAAISIAALICYCYPTAMSLLLLSPIAISAAKKGSWQSFSCSMFSLFVAFAATYVIIFTIKYESLTQSAFLFVILFLFLWSIMFVGGFFYCGVKLFFDSIAHLNKNNNSVYIITKHRIFIIELINAEFDINVYHQKDIQYRKKIVRNDGSGDLFFARAIGKDEEGEYSYIEDIGFKNIADVAAASQAVDALIWENLTANTNTAELTKQNAEVLARAAFSPKVSQAIKAELQLGEKVNWVGAPAHCTLLEELKDGPVAAPLRPASVKPTVKSDGGVSMLVKVILFTLTVLAVLICTFVDDIIIYIEYIAPIILFVLPIMLNSTVARKRQDRKNSAYVITNLRAIYIKALAKGQRKVWSALPPEIAITAARARSDGSGHILFVRETGVRNDKKLLQSDGFKWAPDFTRMKAALMELASHTNSG